MNEIQDLVKSFLLLYNQPNPKGRALLPLGISFCIKPKNI